MQGKAGGRAISVLILKERLALIHGREIVVLATTNCSFNPSVHLDFYVYTMAFSIYTSNAWDKGLVIINSDNVLSTWNCLPKRALFQCQTWYIGDMQDEQAEEGEITNETNVER